MLYIGMEVFLDMHAMLLCTNMSYHRALMSVGFGAPISCWAGLCHDVS